MSFKLIQPYSFQLSAGPLGRPPWYIEQSASGHVGSKYFRVWQHCLLAIVLREPIPQYKLYITDNNSYRVQVYQKEVIELTPEQFALPLRSPTLNQE